MSSISSPQEWQIGPRSAGPPAGCLCRHFSSRRWVPEDKALLIWQIIKGGCRGVLDVLSPASQSELWVCPSVHTWRRGRRLCRPWCRCHGGSQSRQSFRSFSADTDEQDILSSGSTHCSTNLWNQLKSNNYLNVTTPQCLFRFCPSRLWSY